MKAPIGISLFKLVMDNQDSPHMPMKLSEFEDFEKMARKEKFTDLADYIEKWRLYLEYQIKAEWNESQSR